MNEIVMFWVILFTNMFALIFILLIYSIYLSIFQIVNSFASFGMSPYIRLRDVL